MFKLPISKYKNVAPKIVKKEQILNGISSNRLSNTIGSLINCSLKHITFAFDSNSGGNVCTIRHEDLNKRLTFNNENFCVTYAHTGPIADIQYNLFNQSIVATCGFDQQINLWSVDDASAQVGLSKVSSLMLPENRCDAIQWNPNVDNVIVSTSLNTIYLWDVQKPNAPINTVRNHTDAIQSLSWKRDGSLLVTTAKDKTMQVFDPRNKSNQNNLTFEGAKTSNKDSKAVWLGTSDCILSSVYNQTFQRDIQLWDVRNTSAPVHESAIDSGNNVLTPFYDYDTSIVYLVGKAETNVKVGEVFLNDQWSFSLNSAQTLDDQVKAACMLPKFGLDLMKCEVGRMILLTRNSIYPLPYNVPRRAYFDFHADVYPETYNIFEPGLSTSEWLLNKDSPAKKTNLNPEVQKKFFDTGDVASLPTPTTPKTPQEAVVEQLPKPPVANTNVAPVLSTITNKTNEIIKKTEPEITKPEVVLRPNKPAENNNNNNQNGNGHDLNGKNGNGVPGDRKSVNKNVFYQSKFKYINGKAAHKSEQITNIRNLSTMWPSECNGFQVNTKHGAFLISGTSGQIGVVELNKYGRLPDSNIFTIVNKSKVSDFQFDPFDHETLAAACDDGTIKIWKIPEDGLDQSLEVPDLVLQGHSERLYCIQYHPYVRDVLATASYDKTIRIWNLKCKDTAKILKGQTDVVFSLSWSPCGSKLATINKDGYIRVYEPLVSEMPTVESKCGPASGSKAARIEWVLNGAFILVSGFAKGNIRQIYLFDSQNLELVKYEDINQSPSLLIPYYDSDINVLYLYAKGEETLFLYEIIEQEPYFQALTPFKPEGIHFAMAFLPKMYCDIKAAEVSKTYRLTKDNRIEKISFFVPRVKLNYFQDDIYPDTVDLSAPYLTAEQWLNGSEIKLRKINLQPENMTKWTELLAAEQAILAQKPKKEARKIPQEKPKDDFLDLNNLEEGQRKVINSMLGRDKLIVQNSQEEDDDWVPFFLQ